ncbi:MAG: LuxR C-terminal-related transcriptional regulator [Salinisphaeraceae bacterium]
MRFEDLDALENSELEAVDLRSLLLNERLWLVKLANAALSRRRTNKPEISRYSYLCSDDDIVYEIMNMLWPRVEKVLASLVDAEVGTRAAKLRRYIMDTVGSQWPRVFYAQYTTVGEPMIVQDSAEPLEGQILDTDGTWYGEYIDHQTASVETSFLVAEENDDRRRNGEAYCEYARTEFALNAKQSKVLALLVCDGLDNAQIAAVLGCSRNNVYIIRRGIMSKLDDAAGAAGLAD